METIPLVKKSYSVAEQFALAVDPRASIAGFEPGHPAAPVINPGYVFRPEYLRDMLAFWQGSDNALVIVGDPATGKTSIVEQFHARLAWPLYKVPCSPSTESRELIGQLQPHLDGSLKWVDGPVLRAAREGTSVLLDEYNTMDPGEATGLNLLLEGYSITIASTGEIVTPAPLFKVFATENPVNSRLAIAGRNVQDAANDDRFMIMFADYLPSAQEIKVVAGELVKTGVNADVADMLATQVVGIANKVRTAYRNDDGVIVKPMSTRVAIRWAKLVRRFAKAPHPEGPMVYALLRAFRMDDEMTAAVIAFTKASLGTGTSNGNP